MFEGQTTYGFSGLCYCCKYSSVRDNLEVYLIFP
jgi:hypothetical protein